MRLLSSLFLFFIVLQSSAQNSNIHTSFPLNLNGNQRQVQKSDFSFTAVALKSKEIRDFNQIAFIHNSDTIYFSNDLHADENSSYFYSSLIHFDQTISAIQFYASEELSNLEVVLINGSGEYASFSQRKSTSTQNNDCELNDVVQQSEWRVGLPAPSYNRSFTATKNMIVHHSAGSNNISDFTQAVRDIYIFHTQENGWSDIGYNYLVAPDGVIYAGRDPGNGDQDEVLGAHFCGSNSSTMGVCLLGNYETAEPESQMLESLESILSWKASKDGLEPLEENPHPLNANLGIIAGHQDGCNTLCPGENVYNRLQDIRLSVNKQLEICNGEEEEEPIVVIEIDSVKSDKIYPNPINSDYTFNLNIEENQKEQLQFIRIFSTEGKNIKWENLYFYENKIEVKLPQNIKPGLYFLQTSFKNGKENSQRFMIQ